MSLHGRAQSRPEGQTRRHERMDHGRTDREARKRGAERTQSRQAVEAAARNEIGSHGGASAPGAAPVEPGATDINHGPAHVTGATGPGEPSMIGAGGKPAEVDPAASCPSATQGAGTQSIAMGSNVQFIQTHSRPAGQED